MITKQNVWNKNYVFNLFIVFYYFEWQHIFFFKAKYYSIYKNKNNGQVVYYL